MTVSINASTSGNPEPALAALGARVDKKAPARLLNAEMAAAAPTLTVSAANAAVGAGLTQTITRSSPLIRYFGARQVSDVNWGYYRNESVTSTLDRGDFFFYDLMTDSPLFELRQVFDGRLYYRAWVDGVPLQSYVTQVAASAGTYQLKFDFSSVRKARRITIMQNGGLEQLNFGPLDTVWAVNAPFNKRACVLGDSWGMGGGSSGAVTGYWHQLAMSLGIDNMYNASQAGTGYKHPGSGGGRQKFADRLAADVVPFAPDDLFVVGSINDLAYTPAEAAAEASALYASAKVMLPNTRLIVVGIQYVSGAASGTSDAIEAAVSAAAASASNVAAYISTKGWVTGTGTVGATTGSGNADLYRSVDGNHMTEAGYKYWGARIAEECRRLGLY